MPRLGEAADQSPRFAVNVALKIGQRFLAAFIPGLLLEQENGQRPKQGEITRRSALTHRAAVLVLGTIPAIVLPIFDAPVVASDFQQGFWTGLLGPIRGHCKTRLIGFFDHLALGGWVWIRTWVTSAGGRFDSGNISISSRRPNPPEGQRQKPFASVPVDAYAAARLIWLATA